MSSCIQSIDMCGVKAKSNERYIIHSMVINKWLGYYKDINFILKGKRTIFKQLRTAKYSTIYIPSKELVREVLTN